MVQIKEKKASEKSGYDANALPEQTQQEYSSLHKHTLRDGTVTHFRPVNGADMVFIQSDGGGGNQSKNLGLLDRCCVRWGDKKTAGRGKLRRTSARDLNRINEYLLEDLSLVWEGDTETLLASKLPDSGIFVVSDNHLDQERLSNVPQVIVVPIEDHPDYSRSTTLPISGISVRFRDLSGADLEWMDNYAKMPEMKMVLLMAHRLITQWGNTEKSEDLDLVSMQTLEELHIADCIVLGKLLQDLQ
mgnify:CR=1 FL=1